jgi:hypothetical protein
MKKVLLAVAFVLALLTPSTSVGAEIPVDKSDKLIPGLVSVQLGKSVATSGEEVSVTFVIRDDKNAMYISPTIELEAPADAGTAYKIEGFSQWLKVPTLTERKIGDGYVEETWIGSIKAPSYPGLWKGYRVDFGDLAGNRIQFITNGDNTCTFKYPREGIYETNLACIFKLNLTISGSATNQSVVIPEFSQIESFKKSVSELNELIIGQKVQLAKANKLILGLNRQLIKVQSDNQRIQSQLKKVCSIKPKPKGC